jgi:hypothetical protein
MESKQRFTKRARKLMFQGLTALQQEYVLSIRKDNPDFHAVFAFRMFFKEGYPYSKFSKDTNVPAKHLKLWSLQTYEKIKKIT